MRQLFALILFLTTTVSVTAFAQDDIIQDFRNSAYVIPKALYDKGYRNMGDINLSKFANAMNSVEVKAVKEIVVPVQGNDVRTSAQWQRLPNQKPKILVSKKMWQPTPDSYKPLMSLHENLGALGFNDKDYNLSNVMWILAEPSTDKILTNDEKGILLNYLNKAAEGGGVIGVSGGGDMGGVGLKHETLKVQLNDMAKLKSRKDRAQKMQTILFVIQNLGIEIGWQWQK